MTDRTPNRITLAFSPCPNDTFMFHDLATGCLGLGDASLTVSLHDVEELNRRAFDGCFDITKLSFHAFLHVRDTYSLLPVGATLGHGCGPLVVSRRSLSRADLGDCRVALPGEHTTAHLLFRQWVPSGCRKQFVRYDRIFPLVQSGEVDCGVVIHESRFTYAEAGLRLIADLGDWWEEETGLPIPLGCIAVRRELGQDFATMFAGLLRTSISNAFAEPQRVMPYVREHAREMDDKVLMQHIRTFVNDYCLDLGDKGREAVARLAAGIAQGDTA